MVRIVTPSSEARHRNLAGARPRPPGSACLGQASRPPQNPLGSQPRAARLAALVASAHLPRCVHSRSQQLPPAPTDAPRSPFPVPPLQACDAASPWLGLTIDAAVPASPGSSHVRSPYGPSMLQELDSAESAAMHASASTAAAGRRVADRAQRSSSRRSREGPTGSCEPDARRSSSFLRVRLAHWRCGLRLAFARACSLRRPRLPPLGPPAHRCRALLHAPLPHWAQSPCLTSAEPTARKPIPLRAARRSWRAFPTARTCGARRS
jgi:hypothetical protein